MNSKNLKISRTALALLAAAFTIQIAQAHCDGLDGPVVNAARAAQGHFPEPAATPAAAHPHEE